MSIFGFLGDIFGGVEKVIDTAFTSDEERDAAKIELKRLEAQQMAQALAYEKQLLQSQTAIIKAEATGQSWMQRNWRPITMLTFLFLVVCDSFGLLSFRLASEAWVLLQIGLGGYVVGRSAEKIVPKVMNKSS